MNPHPEGIADLLTVMTAGPVVVAGGEVARVYRIRGTLFVDVVLFKDGRRVAARPYAPGAAVRVAIAEGDEAVVLCAGANQNIALVGVESGHTAQTQDVVGVEVTHPDGTAVRRTRLASVEAVVLASAIADLKAHLDTLQLGLQTAGAALSPTAATVVASLAAIATSLQTTAWTLSAALPAEASPYLAKALKSE